VVWYDPFIKALRIGAFLAAHSFTAVIQIGALSGLSYALRRLGDPELFHTVPVTFIFDAMDCVILALYVGFGVTEAFQVFRGDGSGQERRDRPGAPESTGERTRGE
jgi:hypothetical protein